MNDVDAIKAAQNFVSIERDEIAFLFVDCDDWDEIPGVLYGTMLLFQRLGLTEETANAIRCVAEIIYARGYQRGKLEGQHPLTFIEKGEAE